MTKAQDRAEGSADLLNQFVEVGATEQQLADAAGIHFNTAKKFSEGRGGLTRSTLQKIERGLKWLAAERQAEDERVASSPLARELQNPGRQLIQASKSLAKMLSAMPVKQAENPDYLTQNEIAEAERYVLVAQQHLRTLRDLTA